MGIVAIDTRGGIQPYVALAAGLQSAGHAVRMVVPEKFGGLAAAYGVTASELPGDVEARVREMSDTAEMSRISRLRMMRSGGVDRTRQWMAQVDRDCADVDLLLGGVGGGAIAASVAEKRGIPFLAAHLQPLGPPTKAFPGPLWPAAPRALRPMSHRVSAVAVDLMTRPGLAAARRDVLGLPPRSSLRPVGTVYGYSPSVVPTAAEWGPRRVVTGYWGLAEPTGWRAPAELADFLADKDPPVCVGFGSMTQSDPAGLTRMVTAAAQSAGVRVVLLTGWGALAERASDEHVFVARDVPHHWLYQRVTGVVHHGGAGTTAASLSAGRPTLVVPFVADQPFWGSRVAAIGAGPPPIPLRRLTEPKLSAALARLARDAQLSRAAAEVGAQIATEDGVGRAVAAIRDLLASAPRSS